MSYTHFTLDERVFLQKLLEKKYGIGEIARSLGRSPSSVSREIKRNSSKKGYHSWRAQSQAVARRRKACSPGRLKEGTKLGDFVREKLKQYWSPECIAAIWNRDHPDDHVGFITIYRWLKKGLLVGFSRKTHLRRKGKRIQTRNANYNTIHPDRLIADWPPEIVQRLRIGDWEGDTVCGAVGKGRIVTMVDRKSRFLCAARLGSKRPEETKQAVLKALHGRPVLSISFDNGSEFSLFREIEAALNAPVFFAKPHPPWERGSNENVNDLLRFFFHKGCDFLAVSDDQLQAVVDLINSRPRKCLDWKSPFQVFSAPVALT